MKFEVSPRVMKDRMKRILLAAIGLAAAGSSFAAAELVERILARVNDRLITQSEFDKRLEVTSKSGRASSLDAQTMRVMVLEDLIREKLLEERAKEMSVTATDEEILAAVARVKQQYNLATDQEFDAALAQTGMTRDDLKRQMSETIVMQKVIGREVTSRMDLSDDVLRLEYERKKDQYYAVPENARVAEIVLKFPASDAQARAAAAAKAEEIQAKIKAGGSFADLAKEYSEGGTRDKGGDLGVVSKGELQEALDAAIFVTPAAEYPPPVLTADSIHIFRVTERKAAGFKPFAEVKEDLKKRISDDLYEKRFTDYMDKLRRDAFVKIYDDDLAKLDENAKKTS
jgi:peptidyl-prolyl cis-trans isomerase SurA